MRCVTSPCGLFFDYDFPDVQRLAAAFSWLPLVMATEEHSEALAVWALTRTIWPNGELKYARRLLRNREASMADVYWASVDPHALQKELQP